MKHSDTDIGTTSWSEATAESIFSVFEMVIHDRESLTVGHTVVTCRILTNGPKTGTVDAEKLMDDVTKMWPAQAGQQFTTHKWQVIYFKHYLPSEEGSSATM